MKPTKSIGLFVAGSAFGAILGAGALALAQEALLAAPTVAPENHPFASIDLGSSFPALAGYTLNMRKGVLAPGAGLKPHAHKALPEIAYIASGVLSDQRNGGPITTHGPGDVLVNDAGVTHAILNQGSEPVVLYATTVAPPPAPKP
jgi:quercetin dioxygenase-like cupin family protein